MSELIDGCALVTGGGSGIGRAIARELAAAGARVGVVDLSYEGATETADGIMAAGGEAVAMAGDVSRWQDVDAAVSAVVQRLGPLGIMVNAAGVLDGYATMDEMGLGLWERVVAIDLTGTFLGCKRALTEMVATGSGRIINIASAAGLVGGGGGPAYIASKHGVVGLTRYLGVTYAERGITANAICPGVIQTALRQSSARILGADAPVMRGIGGDDAAVRAIAPAGRRGTVEEVAAAARFLASRGAAYITGHTLVVDGGWTAR